ncbi:hypothetical protein AGOR_G00102240 [Albula goreensis]|uniref:Saposin B-type domain-containing protein n=1 Tax=Albula goreensis TaxID=1534307 RepID=A0A8T3DFR0_9TELE|nr:hypothetical protein AGOR_G00102240 [Albula goreensis]
MKLVLLCLLLTCTVMARRWDFHEWDIREVNPEPKRSAVEEQLPGSCWVCKWLLKKVKKTVSTQTGQDEIKKKLAEACDQIGFLKSACRAFIRNYSGILIEELSTTDNVRTICANVKACKRSM